MSYKHKHGLVERVIISVGTAIVGTMAISIHPILGVGIFLVGFYKAFE